MRFHGIDFFPDEKEEIILTKVADYKSHFCVSINSANFFFKNKQQAKDTVSIIISKIKELEGKQMDETTKPVPDELENLPEDIKEEEKILDIEEDSDEDDDLNNDEDNLDEDDEDDTENEVTGNTGSESK